MRLGHVGSPGVPAPTAYQTITGDPDFDTFNVDKTDSLALTSSSVSGRILANDTTVSSGSVKPASGSRFGPKTAMLRLSIYQACEWDGYPDARMLFLYHHCRDHKGRKRRRLYLQGLQDRETAREDSWSSLPMRPILPVTQWAVPLAVREML